MSAGRVSACQVALRFMVSSSQHPNSIPEDVIYWRVEGSLLNLSAVRPIGFFTWRSQRFTDRWMRRGGLALSAVIRPLLYAAERKFATRMLHLLLRGISCDRLDALGEEYFEYHLKPKLKEAGLAKLREAQASGKQVILVSQGLDHVMRPLAKHLGLPYLLANRLEFRDGLATGRLRGTVIRPRQVLARFIGSHPDGRYDEAKLQRMLGYPLDELRCAIQPTARPVPKLATPQVIFEPHQNVGHLSIKESLAGKHVLLIGFTGFIAKVWVANILKDLPEIGKIYLLIRRSRSTPALSRFEKIIAESPLFESFHQQYGDKLPQFIADKIEIVEGDVSAPNLGLDEAALPRLRAQLDVVINSSGLTDFNPDLRQALSINVDATVEMLKFMRSCDHVALLHLSTCYVVGFRDGRVNETLKPNYTPVGISDYDAAAEHAALHKLAADIEARAESPDITAELTAQLQAKGKQLSEKELDVQLRKQRQRWVRFELTEAGMRRARQTFARLGASPRELSEADFVIASSALKQWDPLSPDRGANKDARERAERAMRNYHEANVNNPAANEFTVEAAYWVAKTKRAGGDTRDREWWDRTKTAFEAFRRAAPAKSDGSSGALGSRQAGFAAEAAYVQLDESLQKTFDYDAGNHRYAGTTVEVLDQYRKGAVQAQAHYDALQKVVDDYASPEWATAAIARQGSLYDSLRTGLYNVRPPALKMFDKKTEALLQRAENSDSPELQEQADAVRMRVETGWRDARDRELDSADQVMVDRYGNAIALARRYNVSNPAVMRAIGRLAFFTDVIGEAKLQQHTARVQGLEYSPGLFLRLRPGLVTSPKAQGMAPPVPPAAQ